MRSGGRSVDKSQPQSVTTNPLSALDNYWKVLFPTRRLIFFFPSYVCLPRVCINIYNKYYNRAHQRGAHRHEWPAGLFGKIAQIVELQTKWYFIPSC